MSITLIGPAQIPSLGFGTFQLEQDTVAEMVAAALSEGFRHIDTAQAYENEEQVGKGLRRADVRRDDVFLTTKILPEHFSPEAFIAAADASLKRLGTDYVDLLLLHWPSKEVPIAETIGALNDLISAGKVRHGGVSNFTMDMVDQAQAALNTPLAANQIELHPLIDQTRMIAHLASKGIPVEAYSPLAQGKVMENAMLRLFPPRLTELQTSSVPFPWRSETRIRQPSRGRYPRSNGRTATAQRFVWKPRASWERQAR